MLMSSSSLSATAIPPCAYCVADSVNSCLASTRTRPASASEMAARKPATPAPTTMKSASWVTAFIVQAGETLDGSTQPASALPLGYDGDPVNRVIGNVKPKPYAVLIHNGLLRQAGEHLLTALDRKPSLTAVISVAPVRKHWEAALLASLKAAGVEAYV